MTSVTVLGTGRMGAAMAGTLARGGFEVVVWNRTAAKAREVAASVGGTVAASPADGARASSVVLSSLADDAAVRAVHLGEEGTVSGTTKGTVVLETSTVDPGTIEEVAAAVERSGGHLLDAPVSGSVSLVDAGELTAMVGGDIAVLDRARPVLECLSKAVFHLGHNGAGATMKLAVNALVHATNLALAEALVLAEIAGISRIDAYDVLASSAAASPFVHYKRDAFLEPDTAAVAFSLHLVGKDLDLILSLAGRLGAPMAQGSVTAEVIRHAIDEGLGASDMSSVATHLREALPDRT